MRLPQLAAFASALVLTACFDEASPLQDTLMFPPGLDIAYLHQPAKLYGMAQCAQGQLTGNSCLIFPPHIDKASAVIISGQRIYQVELRVRQDPHEPIYYRLEDAQGNHVLSTTGRHDTYGNIDIRPVALE